MNAFLSSLAKYQRQMIGGSDKSDLRLTKNLLFSADFKPTLTKQVSSVPQGITIVAVRSVLPMLNFELLTVLTKYTIRQKGRNEKMSTWRLNTMR